MRYPQGGGLTAERQEFREKLLNIYAKLGVGDRAAAVTEAFNRGLLVPRTPEQP